MVEGKYVVMKVSKTRLIQKENALSEKLAIKLGFSYCGDREIDGVLMSDYQIEW